MKELFKALAEFRETVPVIHEETKGYNYTYASLGTILKVINPLLKKNGLGFTQLLDGTNLKTIIYHIKSGESIESIVEIPQDVKLASMNAFQVAGSAITYYRRYALSASLGLVTDKDIDAAGEDKPVKTPPVKQPTVKPEVKPTLKINSPEFMKAVQYMSDVGDINAIEKKYILSPAVKKALNGA